MSAPDETAGLPAAEATQAIPAVPEREHKPVLWNGHPVRARWLQQHAWTLLLGTGLGVCLVAGGYDAISQVDWHVNVTILGWHLHFTILNLKPAWDRGAFWPHWLGHWKAYRDAAFRNQLEPALAIVGIMSLAAGPAYWGHRCRGWEVALRAVATVVLAVGLGILGVWLAVTALPDAWAHAASAAGHPGYNLDRQFSWAGRASVFLLLWGFGMALVLHRVWGPAGATIQGYWIDRLADRGKAARHGLGKVALYVKWPFTWPTLRERYSELYLEPGGTGILRRPGLLFRWVIGLLTLVLVLVIALGATGKWYVGTFHNHVPYLFPPRGH